MGRRPVDSRLFRLLWGRLALQFSPEAADALLSVEGLEVSFGAGGRVRQVWAGGEPYLTLRAGDGYFSLSTRAGEFLRRSIAKPRFRVIVGSGVEPVGSVFAKQVVGGDEGLRPGDEAIVVDEEDRLLGVGRVRIPLAFIRGLDRGEVVRLQ
ncbi:PUA domain-containing protein [Aeropyrum pernix]|uniref:PUA domain-containing protein n=1 Tax=Aeropyrum pernix TaxID=56636 RepID=UPI0011E5304C|nr:PUA domain-containing protein [Aeropyrum pernix]